LNGKNSSWKPSNWQFLRFETLKRDDFTCQYCGRKSPEVKLQADHIKPRCEGGRDDLRNLITACADCNAGKWGRSLSKISPTLASIFSSTERKRNALKRLLDAIERNEKECARMEREIQKTSQMLPKEPTQQKKRVGVIVAPKPRRK